MLPPKQLKPSTSLHPRPLLKPSLANHCPQDQTQTRVWPPGLFRSSPCLACKFYLRLSLLAFLPTSILPTPKRNLVSSCTSEWFAIPKDFVLFYFAAFPLALLSGKCLSHSFQDNPPHPSCSGRYYRPWEALPDGPVWFPEHPVLFSPIALVTLTQN